ncbi:hypothetical protein Q5H92_11625 [Hymenobacter sp. M29]|uniref:DUF4174 domain-containing protein n=1 Tax=Hymenobacter mellowenesis TaxID=3063995 RepID=A0ABT9ACW0_9BACT|nr:hypothetical protein [Hymenobacter sp. M29]MDO7847010.1 hypothetical protein [Hymenobacter sp. M29]
MFPSFPFAVLFTDDSERPYQLIAKFDDPELASYKALFDRYSLSDYRVSLVDTTILIVKKQASSLLDYLEFDEEGYWLDMSIEHEPVLPLFISAVCPIFQDLILLETYVRQVADEHKV